MHSQTHTHIHTHTRARARAQSLALICACVKNIGNKKTFSTKNKHQKYDTQEIHLVTLGEDESSLNRDTTANIMTDAYWSTRDCPFLPTLARGEWDQC